MATPSLYGKPLSVGDTLWVREEGWRTAKDAPFTQATVKSFTDKGTIRVTYLGETHLLVTPHREKAHLRGEFNAYVYLTKNQAEYFTALDELKRAINHHTSELARLLAEDGSTPETVFSDAISDVTEATRILNDSEDN